MLAYYLGFVALAAVYFAPKMPCWLRMLFFWLCLAHVLINAVMGVASLPGHFFGAAAFQLVAAVLFVLAALRYKKFGLTKPRDPALAS